MKKMKKQLLLVLLALMPMMVSAEVVEIGGLWYNLISKAKVAELTSSSSGSAAYSGDIIIPESVIYNNVEYRVVAIVSAFSNCTNLISVSIPKSVTDIGINAFSGCTGLTSITIPNSVTTIGSSAFQGCTGLTSVTIPNSVTTIGPYAFSDCTGLTTITIPNSVTTIGTSAFSRCSSLTFITIPNSVTTIGDSAFSGCTGLSSITIPNNVTNIDNFTFYRCSSLSSIIIPNSVTNIGKEAFRYCSNLSSLSIPNNVITIDSYAFSECSSLTSINIPNSVTSIGYSAFRGCSGLNSVTIGDGVTIIYNQAFYNCSNLTSVCFSNSIISICSGAFTGCNNLNSVYINSISSWCNNIFVDYDANPLYFAHHLFVNGEEVTDLIIPNDVTTINNYSFCGCSYLNSVTIANSVTNIGYGAFTNCENIADVYSYAEAVPTTQNDAFGGSYIQYATLHVPADLIGAFRSTAPWNTILNIVPIEGEIPKVNKCATPTIEYSNGNVICNCETDGVKYIYQIAPVTVQRESESGRFSFAPTYEIKVYAKREGYKDSDTASLIVSLTNVGDVNGDGQVSIADVTSLVNAILGK